MLIPSSLEFVPGECVWFWSSLLLSLSHVVLLRANKAGWSLLLDDGLGRQEGSGFLSALAPAVSPVCPQGLALKGWARGVRRCPCLERHLVGLWHLSTFHNLPLMCCCLWSHWHTDISWTMTSNPKEVLCLSSELVGLASAWHTDPRLKLLIV